VCVWCMVCVCVCVGGRISEYGYVGRQWQGENEIKHKIDCPSPTPGLHKSNTDWSEDRFKPEGQEAGGTLHNHQPNFVNINLLSVHPSKRHMVDVLSTDGAAHISANRTVLWWKFIIGILANYRISHNTSYKLLLLLMSQDYLSSVPNVKWNSIQFKDCYTFKNSETIRQ
jgi:hypothetical protein